MSPRPKGDLVGGEIAGAPPGGLQLLRGIDLRRDGAHDGPCYLLLHLEDVFKHAVVAFRPDVIAGQCVDQLAAHANPVRRFADAAFQHVADAQFPADLPGIGRFALVGERRVSGDHEQRVEPRQFGDDVFGNTVGEKLLFRIAAHIQERQHRDRRLVGERQRNVGDRRRRPIAGAAGTFQSAGFHFTSNARTGRSMFLRAISPSSSNVALSRPAAASWTLREIMIPPGGASVSRRAAMFTPSP